MIDTSTGLTVVWDRKTRKMIPFTFGPFGDVIIYSGNWIDPIVSKIPISRLDFFNGYVLAEGEVYAEE